MTVYRSDSFKRAELGPFSFDVLFDKTTDEKLTKDGLTTLNPSFLHKIPLTIQKGTMGTGIKRNTGGFVITTDNDKKMNYSTCGNTVLKGNKVLYTIWRNALKKYKSDTEKENERPTSIGV